MLFSHLPTHSIPPLLFLPLLSLSSTVFGVFLSATWVSLTAPWCGVWWVPGECTPSHPESFPVCNPWVMAVDACCTTRHWLSDCVSAWLTYRFERTHVSVFLYSTQSACLGNLYWLEAVPKWLYNHPRLSPPSWVLKNFLCPLVLLLFLFYRSTFGSCVSHKGMETGLV